MNWEAIVDGHGRTILLLEDNMFRLAFLVESSTVDSCDLAGQGIHSHRKGEKTCTLV